VSHSRAGRTDVIGDLADGSVAEGILELMEPDVVVNLAGLTDVDGCEKNPLRAYQANVRPVENIVAWIAGARHPCHLIQISTDQVYDGTGDQAEQDIAPSNYYALSKYAGELVAKVIPAIVLRTNFFGRSECAHRKSFSDWVVESAKAGKRVTVFDDVYFTPLSLSTIAAMIALVVERGGTGTFNMGSKRGMSKADFAFRLADVLGLPTTGFRRGLSTEVNLAAYRPKDMRMDSTPFERAFQTSLPTLTEEIQSMKGRYETSG
jgi:dTDP-4-dehydrorhamnose reductase